MEYDSVLYDCVGDLEVSGFDIDIELDTGEGTTKPETPIIAPDAASSMDIRSLTSLKVEDTAGIGKNDDIH